MIICLLIIFGLVIGSFLNVCIYRVPRKLKVNNPRRSFCTSCNAQLHWYENVPVFAWLIQRGRCRHCQAPISGRYPLVELLSALAMVASYVYYGLTPTAAVVYAITAALIVISFIDLDFKIIPNVISLPGICIGLGLGLIGEIAPVFHPPITTGILDSVIGMLAGGGFFFIIGEAYYLCTKSDGLGGGDIKLMGMTGAVLGWQSVAPTIFVGSLCGAVVGIFLIVFRGGNRKLEIPFGPWLSLGALSYLFTDIPFFRF